MKLFGFCVLLLLILTSVNVLGQSPKAIEADLLTAFKKINYWDKQRSTDTTMAWSDSLDKANNLFGDKLRTYAMKYPFTINLSFHSFNDQILGITDSGDGLFRIYSWNTQMGGTMRDFRNVIQYKTGRNTRAYLVLDTASTNDDNYTPEYSKLHILKAGNKIYYLGIYNGVYSSHNMSEGVHIFSIENGVLNMAPNIIKTKTGLHSKIEYYYDLFLALDNHELHYDKLSKTLYIPIATDNGKVLTNYITYKFTGKYFEKIKSK